MNTVQILKQFRGNKKFIGVYPVDRLPKYVKITEFRLVVNTDKANQRGEHWVAIYVKQKKGEYFDRFGLPPLINKLIKFLNNHCNKNWVYNNKLIQALDSITCGKYYIFYLKARYKKVTKKQLLALFTTSLDVNENILKNIIKTI